MSQNCIISSVQCSERELPSQEIPPLPPARPTQRQARPSESESGTALPVEPVPVKAAPKVKAAPPVLLRSARPPANAGPVVHSSKAASPIGPRSRSPRAWLGEREAAEEPVAEPTPVQPKAAPVPEPVGPPPPRVKYSRTTVPVPVGTGRGTAVEEALREERATCLNED